MFAENTFNLLDLCLCWFKRFEKESKSNIYNKKNFCFNSMI